MVFEIVSHSILIPQDEVCPPPAMYIYNSYTQSKFSVQQFGELLSLTLLTKFLKHTNRISI